MKTVVVIPNAGKEFCVDLERVEGCADYISSPQASAVANLVICIEVLGLIEYNVRIYFVLRDIVVLQDT